MVWAVLEAGAAPLPWDGEALSTPAAQLLDSSRGLRPSEPADLYVLLDEWTYRIEADGRVTRTQHRVMRIETSAGLPGAGEISEQWNPWYQERPRIRARIVNPDGSETRIDDTALIEGSAFEQQQARFSSQKRLHGPLPALVVGALVEYEISVVETQPFFDAGVAHRIFLGGWAPHANVRVIIDAPANMPLRYRLQGVPEAKSVDIVRDGRRRISVDTGPLHTLEELPALLPDDARPLPTFEFSNGADWSGIARAYAEKTEPLLAAKAPATTPEDRDTFIRGLLERLQENVRYTGLDLNASGLIPAAPEVTWSRKFGDCKDKSAWLVARLREAGIPAYMALLAIGDRVDVPQDMPGMGLFNHAIVYVPGERELWIDATAEYARVGALPSESRNRWALIVAPGADQLKRTPAATPDDNLLVEHREFELAPRGKSRVVERTLAYGDSELVYRSEYSSQMTKERREQIEQYVSAHYLTKRVTSITHSDPARLDAPFELRIEAEESARGATDLFEAAVGVTLPTIYERLPDALTSDPDPAEDPRTEDYVFDAIATEWRYRIRPPTGFALRELPLRSERRLGPALLTQRLTVEPDGVVRLDIRFDSVKGRYTVDEAKALRSALRELDAEPTMIVYFDHEANAQLRAGKVRSAIDLLQSAVAAKPKLALPRARLADALLKLGMAERARREALAAVRLEPRNAIYHTLLGDILGHDELGRHLRPGFDRDGAVAAYRRALQLDPTLEDTRAALAVALEHDREGERYSKGASLDDAIQEYLERRRRMDDVSEDTFATNLLIALYFAGRHEQLIETLDELPADRRDAALRYASLTITRGTPEAIESLDTSVTDQKTRETLALATAQRLAQVRRYDLSRAHIDALLAKPATRNRESLRGLSDLYAKASSYSSGADESRPASKKVRALVHQMIIGSEEPHGLGHLLSQRMASELAVLRDSDIQRINRTVRNSRGDNFAPLPTLADIVVAGMSMREEDSPSVGTRVTASVGGKNLQLYVGMDGGQQRIVAIEADSAGFGILAESRLALGDLVGARQWLDWAAEHLPTSLSDNFASGSMYARFWRQGRPADADSIRMAAAVLRIEGGNADVDPTVFARAAAESTPGRDPFALPLARARLAAQKSRWDEAAAAMSEVLHAAPESRTALLAMASYTGLAGDSTAFEGALSLATSSETAKLEARVQFLQGRGQFESAASALRPLIEEKRATNAQVNSFAWMALATNSVDPLAIDAIRTLATQNRNGAAVLHTIACVQALAGQVTEARETFLNFVRTSGAEAGDANVTLAQGVLAEAIGDYESARAYYTQASSDPADLPLEIGSSAKMARLRLARLP